MLTIAQIGCGYWGPNLLRNFVTNKNARVKLVAEINPERLAFLNDHFPTVRVTREYRDILLDKEISAVIVATAAQTHYQIVKEILEYGKHCFVEKPLAMTSDEGKELCALADQKGLVLMVGHTFLYNAAVRQLKELIEGGTVGETYYVYAQRLNLGIVRKDINALWNLAPHDISILMYILGQEALAVSAQGIAYLQEGIEDVAFLHLRFPGNITAHLHVSWLDPGKVRRMTVVGSKKMIIYDDVAEAKIQIYDKGIDKKQRGGSLDQFQDFGEFQLIQRAGDILFPKLSFTEPLKMETAHFLECIASNSRPLTDGFNGLAVTRVLEAADYSMKNNGITVSLKD